MKCKKCGCRKFTIDSDHIVCYSCGKIIADLIDSQKENLLNNRTSVRNDTGRTV